MLALVIVILITMINNIITHPQGVSKEERVLAVRQVVCDLWLD